MNEVKLPPLPEWFATATQHLQADVQAYARAAIEANTQAVPDGWAEAYASFKGAFDNAVARRKDDSEYANDARQRLREFNAALLAASPQPVVQHVQQDPLTPLTQAIQMYEQHPTYRGTRALRWLEAPQEVRDEWLQKAANHITKKGN